MSILCLPVYIFLSNIFQSHIIQYPISRMKEIHVAIYRSQPPPPLSLSLHPEFEAQRRLSPCLWLLCNIFPIAGTQSLLSVSLVDSKLQKGRKLPLYHQDLLQCGVCIWWALIFKNRGIWVGHVKRIHVSRENLVQSPFWRAEKELQLCVLSLRHVSRGVFRNFSTEVGTP